MEDVETAFRIFTAEGGIYFLQLATLVAVILGIAWLSWRIGMHLAQEKARIENAKEIAIGQLVEELRDQHKKCEERVALLEARVMRLETRERELEREKQALHDLVLSLRRRIYVDDQG